MLEHAGEIIAVVLIILAAVVLVWRLRNRILGRSNACSCGTESSAACEHCALKEVANEGPGKGAGV